MRRTQKGMACAWLVVGSLLIASACGEARKEGAAGAVGSAKSALRADGEAALASPVLSCLSPRNLGEIQLAPGALLVFEGQVETSAPITELRVNGALVAVDGEGRFFADLATRYGMNFVELTALDEAGQSAARTCTFLSAPRWIGTDEPLPDAASIKLTPRAVDDQDGKADFGSLNDLMLSVLRTDGLIKLLDQALSQKGMLLDQCFVKLFGWCMLSTSIRYHEIQAGVGQVNSDSRLTLTDRGVLASLTLRELRARITVAGTLHKATGWATLRDTHVEMLLAIGVQNGLPAVTTSEERVSVGGVGLDDFHGLNGWLIKIVGGIFHSVIQGMVGDKVREYLASYLPAMFDEILGKVDLGSLAPSFELARLDKSGTVRLGVGLGVSSVSINPARVLLGLSTSISPRPRSRSGLGVAVPGASELPDPQITSPLAAVLHVGVMNQLLHALWRERFFDVDLSGESVGVDFIAGLRITTRVDLPPVLALDPVGKKVQLMIGGMTVRVDAPDMFERPFEAEVGAVTGARIDLEGELLHLTDLQVLELVVSPVAGTLSIEDQGLVEEMLLNMLKSAMDSTLAGLLPVVPLPTFKLPPEMTALGLPADLTVGLGQPSVAFTPNHLVVEGQFLKPPVEDQPIPYEPTFCSPFGGIEGGSPFNDWADYLGKQKAAPRIQRLTLRSGDRLDQLAVTYADWTTLRHGGGGGSARSVTLGPDEYLTAVEIHRDRKGQHDRVFYLRFRSNLREEVLSGGGARAEEFKRHLFTAPLGYQIEGFSGSSGDELDSLAPIFTPIPSADPALSDEGADGLPQGTFFVETFSGRTWDITKSSPDSGAELIQFEPNGGPNQRFLLEPAPDGQRTFRALHSGKCLEVDGGALGNGARVLQRDCALGSLAQRFALQDRNDGTFSVIAAHSRKCLDVDGSSKKNWARLIQYDCHGQANQGFTFVKAR